MVLGGLSGVGWVEWCWVGRVVLGELSGVGWVEWCWVS